MDRNLEDAGVGPDNSLHGFGYLFGFAGCRDATRERLTTIAAHGPANVDDTFWSYGRAYRDDRYGPEYQLKPGYWQATAESVCLYYDRGDEDWKQGSRRGTGWVVVNGSGVEFDQSTRIRIEHGDGLEVTTWSGGPRGATKCELNWVADLD